MSVIKTASQEPSVSASSSTYTDYVKQTCSISAPSQENGIWFIDSAIIYASSDGVNWSAERDWTQDVWEGSRTSNHYLHYEDASNLGHKYRKLVVNYTNTQTNVSSSVESQTYDLVKKPLTISGTASTYMEGSVGVPYKGRVTASIGTFGNILSNSTCIIRNQNGTVIETRNYDNDPELTGIITTSVAGSFSAEFIAYDAFGGSVSTGQMSFQTYEPILSLVDVNTTYYNSKMQTLHIFCTDNCGVPMVKDTYFKLNVNNTGWYQYCTVYGNTSNSWSLNMTWQNGDEIQYQAFLETTGGLQSTGIGNITIPGGGE